MSLWKEIKMRKWHIKRLQVGELKHIKIVWRKGLVGEYYQKEAVLAERTWNFIGLDVCVGQTAKPHLPAAPGI